VAGGVPAECVYDNPKTAVVRILAGPVREEHTRFSSLRAHYLFESQFCRPGQAHEKGAVEHLVGYVRRNALVPVPRFAGWAELNAHLLAWCEGEREQRAAAWAQEQARLRPLPAPPFVPALTRLVPVSRLSLIRFDHNRYSVPGRYVGRTLRLAAFTDRLELWDGEVPVATHRRQYQRGQTQLELAHYLPALARKPRAVSHAAVVAQLPPIYATVRDDLCRQDPEGYRRFAALLLLHQEFPAEVVTTALEHAWQQHCLDVAVVRQLALNQVAPPRPAPVPVPAVLDQLRLAPLDLSQYDRLPAEVTR